MNNNILHRGRDDEGYLLINQGRGSYQTYSGPSSPIQVQQEHDLFTEGIRFEGTIGLAHRRFAIIDLSPSAHQPFFDRTGSVAIVFNGELYNYLEVRAELMALGHHFRTASDTEVLVEAYKAWGTDCFDRFSGMWSLALYDWSCHSLIVSRDPLGKLPLYWVRTDDYLCFASEIKALLEIPSVSATKGVNEAVLFNFLITGQRDVDHHTFYAGIHSFPEASWSIVDEEFPNKVRRYWSLPKSRLSEKDISIDEAAAQLRATLRKAVKIRMRADVDWCVELSGGIDSSVVTALAAEEVGQGKLTAYTAQFPEAQYDESEYAASLAHYVGAQHQIVRSPEAGYWQDLMSFTHLQEEPYHSPVLYVNQSIRRLMSSRGMKVFLSGIGGDELFCGYPTHFSPSQIRNLMSFRWSLYLENGLQWTEGKNKIANLILPLAAIYSNRLGALKQQVKGVLGLESWRRDVPDYIGKNVLVPSYDFGSKRWNIDHMLAEHLNTLIPYWLRSGDKTYMGIPTETRAPFLDPNVVQLAFSLPTSYMVRDGWHKWIVRKAFEKMLPPDVVWRKKKLGYPFPYARFLVEHSKIVQLILSRSDNPFVIVKAFNQFDSPQACYFLSFVVWYEYFFRENYQLFRDVKKLAEDHKTPLDS